MTRRPLCLVCLILMLCMWIADLAGIPLVSGVPLPDTVQAYIEKHPNAVICGEVQQYQTTEFSFSVCLKQVFLIVRSEKIPIENVKVFLKKEEDLPPGTFAVFSGRLEAVAAPRNPGEFDSRQYHSCQHIYYFMKKAVLKKKSSGYSGYRQKLLELKEQVLEILRDASGKDAPIFEAMLLGEKTDLDQEVKMRYQMAGMIHILAISGLHISILGMGLFSLMKKMRLGNGTAGFLSLMVMLQYGIFTGGSVSSMRAVCMFVLSVGAKILGRTYDILTALAVSAILLLLDSSAYLYSSSFLLSFGAVVGVAFVLPCLTKIMGIRSRVGKALAGSAAVQLSTLPIMLTSFGEVSVAGIFLNLAVLPTVGGVLLSGLCCSIVGFINREAAAVAVVPGRVLLWFYEKLGMLAGKLPFCTWIGGKPEVWQWVMYYGLMTLGIFWGLRIREKKKRTGRIFLCSIVMLAGILILSWHPQNKLRITCLDIGQGDGIVLELPEKGVFLMDCGSSNKKNTAAYQLLPYLKSRGISYIDGIFVSHTDSDHISGIQELLEYMSQGLTSVKAGTLILPRWREKPEAYQLLENLAKKAEVQVLHIENGDVFSSGKVKFRILAPLKNTSGENVNEDGMVMEVEYGEFQGLFTGDIGMDTEKKLLPEFSDVDFLKTAHHGSRHSTCQEFLDRVKPELAVISCSDSNTYGHPSPETTLRMKKNGIKVEYTMKNGAVILYTDGIHIWTERFIKEQDGQKIANK